VTSRTASAEREPGRPIVVKLGGSLAESRRLARILQIVAASRVPVVVVPGGGAFADAVRRAQADFGLPDAAAHRMALLAMHQTGLMLAALNGRLEPVETLPAMRAALTRSAIPVWLPYKMASRDTRIPADWSATSDGLAARLAERLGGVPVVLIKSCRVSKEMSVEALAKDGIVDPTFKAVVERAPLPWHVFGVGDDEALAALLEVPRGKERG
jgi:aspartokinase-like uncharacterized kinase